MRKIALGLALSSVLATNSHAVGLGEIVTNSSLNQPLNASIELVDTTSADVDDLEVTLAPTAVFDQVGIARSSALEKLEFIPTIENGVPTIKVTSLQPIQEPFLNFVLEVTWANGKLLREYTVLLDPPVFSDTQYAAVPATLPVMDQIPDAPEATPFVDVVVPEPEMMAPSIDAIADSGLDPFVSIPDAGVGAFAGLDALDVVPDGFDYQGMETFAVEGDSGIPEAVAFTEVFTDDSNVFVEAPGQDVPIFVDSIPLESATDVAAYADGIEGEYGAVNYEDYAYEDTLPVDDVALALLGPDGVDEIFIEEVGTALAYNEGDIFVSEPQAYNDTYAAESYEIVRGDTLGSIARGLTDSSSVSQMMVGLMRSNPKAFINNNMNLIKSGYVMRVPDAAEVSTISRREALAEIASHTSSWNKYRTEVASTALPQFGSDRLAGIEDLVGLDRDALASVPEVEVTVEGDTNSASMLAEVSDLVVKPFSELEILVPAGEGDAVEGNADTASGAIGNLSKELSLSKEQLVSATSKNDELRSRVSELESLLSSKNRLIELKNEQLSDLQGQMAEVKSQVQEKSIADTLKDTAGAAVNKVAETAKGVLPRTEDAAPFTGLEPNKKAEAETTTKIAETKPKTPVVDESEKSGLVEDVKDNPNLLMGLGFGGLLLAALGWLVLRRKDEPEYVAPDIATPLSPIVTDGKADVVEESKEEVLDIINQADVPTADAVLEPALSESAIDGLDELVIEPDLPVSSVDESQAGIEDDDEVMSEANVYLAYGLQDQAVDLLKPVVNDNPERTDYALKLLEAYQSTDAKDDILELAEKVHGQIPSPETSHDWSKVAVMGKSLLPGNSLFEGVDTGDLSMTQIRTKPPELADVSFGPDDSLTGDSLENTISEMKEESIELVSDSTVDQVSEINASELTGLSADLESEFDSEIDLSGDEALDTLRSTKIDIDGKEVEDAFSDIDLDVDDLDIDSLSLTVDDELIAPSEIIDPSKHAANLDVPMDERLNLDTLVGEDADEGLFSTGEDEISTKLDLAKAYLDMGDDEGAREALEEVISLGTPAQRDEAEKLKAQVG